MNADELEAEISYLLSQMQNQPEDRHELFMKLQERVHRMQAYGMPIPDDLSRFLSELEQEFTRGMDPGDGGDGGGNGGG